MSKDHISETEVWKPIPAHPGYEASNLGRIRGLDRTITTKRGVMKPFKGRIMKPSDCLPKGYLTIGFGAKKRRCLHILVLEAFVGPCPDGHESAHEDGNPRNNRIDNLTWKTPKQNNADKKKHGTNLEGELCPWSLLNNQQAIAVKQMLADGHSILVIANHFHVNRSVIQRIKLGHSYKSAFIKG